jgi:hypothetical protein
MEHTNKDKYLKEIKKYDKKISKKNKYVSKHIYQYLGVGNNMGTIKGMDVGYMKTDLEHNYVQKSEQIEENFYNDLLSEKIDHFLKIYTEYYYLSNINLSKTIKGFNLYSHEPNIDKSLSINWYEQNKSLNIELEEDYISITGIFHYKADTSIYYDKYHKKIFEIFEILNSEKMKRVFDV